MNEGDILLVEDNPDDVELTLRAFRRHHLKNTVLVARDGADALDMLHRADAGAIKPSMILLDLKLPRVNGLEVLKALRADPRTALVPVVVLTSSVEEEDIVGAYQFGANSYIRKPVDFTAFVDVMQQLGMYWLLLNQMAPTE